MADETVAVLLSEKGGAYAEYRDALERALAEPGRAGAGRGALRAVELPPLPPADGRGDPQLPAGVVAVVAVGVRAMSRAAAMEGGPPVLNVLVPRASYQKLSSETGRARRRSQFSAIYLDQPLVRQFNLVRRTLPGRQRVSALLGPDSAPLLPRLRSAAKLAGLELSSEEVGQEEEIVPALARVLASSDVLLALPDGLVFTRDTARAVLLTSYRHRKPLIGFSQGYVGAGALAAVYSSPAQIARQTAELLQALPPGRIALPEPLYPAYFSVAVNRSVARALALDVPDDALLAAELATMPEGE